MRHLYSSLLIVPLYVVATLSLIGRVFEDHGERLFANDINALLTGPLSTSLVILYIVLMAVVGAVLAWHRITTTSSTWKRSDRPGDDGLHRTRK